MPSGIVDLGRTSSEGGGPTSPEGRTAERPRRRTHAEPDSSPRRPAGASRYLVLRPSLLNSASRRAIGRNLALDLVVAVGMGVTMALVNALLPTIARRGGLHP